MTGSFPSWETAVIAGILISLALAVTLLLVRRARPSFLRDLLLLAALALPLLGLEWLVEVLPLSDAWRNRGHAAVVLGTALLASYAIARPSPVATAGFVVSR